MLTQLVERGSKFLSDRFTYEPVETSNEASAEQIGTAGRRSRAESLEQQPVTPTTRGSRRTRTSSLASPEEAVLIEENYPANDQEMYQERGQTSLSRPDEEMPASTVFNLPRRLPPLLGPGIPSSASNAILSVGGFQPMMPTSTMKQHASDFNLPKLSEPSASSYSMIRLGAPFWACFSYSLVSTSMVLVNKLLLSTYKFRYPMVLLFHQNLMTVNSLYIAREMGVATYEPLERHKVLRWLPMDIFFVIMLLTGFYSVELLSVPMITIFKNTNNIFIALGDALVFGNIPSQGVVWTMVLMLLAAVMAALNDLEYTFNGYMWTLGNCLASTLFVLYAQTAIAKTNLSTFGKVYYNNILSLPLVMLVDLFVFKDFARLLSADKEQILTFLSPDFIALWFLSGFLGFAQSMSSLRAQHLTSPTTYSMVGSLNKIPLTFLGVVIFHSAMTAKSVLYVSLSIIAGGLYSYTKAKEDIMARAAKQQQEQHSVIVNQQARAGKTEPGLEVNPILNQKEGGAHLRHQYKNSTNDQQSGMSNGGEVPTANNARN